MENLKTLHEAIIHFSNFENCKAVMVLLRWPDGKVKCPECGSEKVTYLAKNRVWKCYTGHSKPKFSLKTGTIFEDSPIALEKWLPALWLVVNCKNGISSCELARDLGITQKSAWFMAHRLRYALKSGGFNIMSGECEADETFIGGKARKCTWKLRNGASPEAARLIKLRSWESSNVATKKKELIAESVPWLSRIAKRKPCKLK